MVVTALNKSGMHARLVWDEHLVIILGYFPLVLQKNIGCGYSLEASQ